MSELSLEISKQLIWWNGDFCNFYSLKPNTPTFELVLEIFLHVVSEMVSVSQNFSKWTVCNQISQNWFTHGLYITVRITTFHVFVTSEWTIFISENWPESESCDDDSLHLFCDIIGSEFYLFDLWGEFHNGIGNTNKGFQTNSCFDECSISNDQKPFIWLRFNPMMFENESQTCCSNNQARDSPHIFWWREEDWGNKAAGSYDSAKDFLGKFLSHDMFYFNDIRILICPKFKLQNKT